MNIIKSMIRFFKKKELYRQLIEKLEEEKLIRKERIGYSLEAKFKKIIENTDDYEEIWISLKLEDKIGDIMRAICRNDNIELTEAKRIFFMVLKDFIKDKGIPSYIG